MKIAVRLFRWLLTAVAVYETCTYVLVRYVLPWAARNHPAEFIESVKASAARQGISDAEVYRRLQRGGYRGPTHVPVRPARSARVS